MRKYDFVALDCEKANNEATSLCSIGIACFKNGKVVKQKEYIIRPVPCRFYKGIEDAGKTTYHGVKLDIYKRACSIKDLWPRIYRYIKDEIITGHNINGDYLTIKAALAHYGIKWEIPSINESLCTNIASIYTYPECESHKLDALCHYLGISIKPHHALSDAKACGYLVLKMIEDTGSGNISELIKICNRCNEIIINKYTEKNIIKYEREVLEMFNFNQKEIELIKKNQRGFCGKIIEFFKNHQNDRYLLPKIQIIPCLTPIIEIIKNEKYSDYFDRLESCRPFHKDSLLFINDQDTYLLFVGVLVDKIDLIRNIFAFLARDSIRINSENKYECIYRSFHKHLKAVNLLAEYLYIVDDFEEYEVYEFIEYFYNMEVEKSKSFDYIKDHNMIYRMHDYRESYDKYLSAVRERMQMIAVYASLQENFSLFSSGLKLPNNIFSRDTNLLVDLYHIFMNVKDVCQVREISYAIKEWYDRNVW